MLFIAISSKSMFRRKKNRNQRAALLKLAELRVQKRQIALSDKGSDKQYGSKVFVINVVFKFDNSMSIGLLCSDVGIGVWRCFMRLGYTIVNCADYSSHSPITVRDAFWGIS